MVLSWLWKHASTTYQFGEGMDKYSFEQHTFKVKKRFCMSCGKPIEPTQWILYIATDRGTESAMSSYVHSECVDKCKITDDVEGTIDRYHKESFYSAQEKIVKEKVSANNRRAQCCACGEKTPTHCFVVGQSSAKRKVFIHWDCVRLRALMT